MIRDSPGGPRGEQMSCRGMDSLPFSPPRGPAASEAVLEMQRELSRGTVAGRGAGSGADGSALGRGLGDPRPVWSGSTSTGQRGWLGSPMGGRSCSRRPRRLWSATCLPGWSVSMRPRASPFERSGTARADIPVARPSVFSPTFPTVAFLTIRLWQTTSRPSQPGSSGASGSCPTSAAWWRTPGS